MAIKIIKEGRKKIAVYGAKCYHCDCEFEFNKIDFLEVWDRTDHFGKIKCPHCERDVMFSVAPKRYDIVK
jgi:hypothetical protein